jgi:hypothetical protein
LLVAFVEAFAARKIERRISSDPDVVTLRWRRKAELMQDATVTDHMLVRARAGDEDAFRELTDPAPPFSGLDTLPSLGVVLLSIGVLLEDFAIVAAAIAVGVAGVLLEIVLGRAAINGIGKIF